MRDAPRLSGSTTPWFITRLASQGSTQTLTKRLGLTIMLTCFLINFFAYLSYIGGHPMVDGVPYNDTSVQQTVNNHHATNTHAKYGSLVNKNGGRLWYRSGNLATKIGDTLASNQDVSSLKDLLNGQPGFISKKLMNVQNGKDGIILPNGQVLKPDAGFRKEPWGRAQLENGTYKRTNIIVNPHNYSFVKNQEAKCLTEGEEEELLLLIIVCSAVSRFQQRIAIRETWGSAIRNKNYRTRLVFMLGLPTDDSLQIHVDNESAKYNDLIQKDFYDTYKNLSVKTMAALNWVDTFCKNAKFVLKTDDDMYINVPKLLTDLSTRTHRRFLMGDAIIYAQPARDKRSKWYTPEAVFPYDHYPKYLSGTAYVISQTLVHDLYTAATETKVFWLEDVFITGMCAKRIGAKLEYNVGFSYNKRTMDPCVYRVLLTGHRLMSAELYKIWRELHRPDLDCRNKKISESGQLLDDGYSP